MQKHKNYKKSGGDYVRSATQSFFRFLFVCQSLIAFPRGKPCQKHTGEFFAFVNFKSEYAGAPIQGIIILEIFSF